jgi:hypothetical protein
LTKIAMPSSIRFPMCSLWDKEVQAIGVEIISVVLTFHTSTSPADRRTGTCRKCCQACDDHSFGLARGDIQSRQGRECILLFGCRSVQSSSPDERDEIDANNARHGEAVILLDLKTKLT